MRLALALALAVRRSIVAPFVKAVVTAESASPSIDESGPANPGFLPSTPHSDEVRSNLRRLVSQQATAAV